MPASLSSHVICDVMPYYSSNTRLRKHKAVQTQGCANTRLCKHKSVQIQGCANTRLCKHKAVQTQGCANTSVRLHFVQKRENPCFCKKSNPYPRRSSPLASQYTDAVIPNLSTFKNSVSDITYLRQCNEMSVIISMGSKNKFLMWAKYKDDQLL